MLLAAGSQFAFSAGAEPNETATETISEGAANSDFDAQPPVLPDKDSIEYWVVRSEAVTELVPFLTQKRSDIKKKRQFLADYLVRIDKAADFAALNMPVKYDAQLYAEILQIGEAFEQMNVEVPKERPSWDSIVEIAMQHVLFEGYYPTDVEEGAEKTMYIDICRKKEEYGQKVRQDIRSLLDQSAKVWAYLKQIDELDNFKAYAADIILAQKAEKAQKKAQYTEMHQQDVIAREQERQERKFEDAEARAEFRSGRRERAYEDRQSRLQYRQTLLDERYTNSRAYWY